MSGKNLLHTYSKYANEYIDTGFIDDLLQFDSRMENTIQKLEAKEKQLYAQFGETDFDGFRTKLRNLFASEDIDVLRRFEPAYIDSQLKGLTRQADLLEQEVKFVFDFSKLNKMGLKLRDPNNTQTEYELTYTYNGQATQSKIKTVLKQVLKGHNFVSESDSKTAAEDLITKMLLSDALKIEFGKKQTANGAVYTQTYQVHHIPNYPWGLSKKIYDWAVQTNNTTILQDIDRAVDTIYRFVLENLGAGASKDMRLAIKNLWRKQFGQSSKGQIAIFFSGGSGESFISGVQGALGEFQSALLFEYVSQKGAAKAFPLIKGSTRLESTLHKEQARSDVEIFKSIGLQVKNFNLIEKEVNGILDPGYRYDIETKIHPTKMSKMLPLMDKDDFLGFLANCFFNASYRDQQSHNLEYLRIALGNWLGEAMNMAVKDSVEDTVTFYMFSGRYLVPCSQILKIADRLELTSKLQITGPASSKLLTDKGFHHTVYKEKKNEEGNIIKTTSSVPFKQYWKRNDSNQWEATDKNKTYYKNLISSLISIRTNFNYFDEIANYAIF